MSITSESQPLRAIPSADAELGMPSQPLMATPPFFQRVLSLFSRKASLPFLGFFRILPRPWVRRAVNPMLRLTPHADTAEYRFPPSCAPGRDAPNQPDDP